MSEFKRLFGVPARSIKKNCIIMPFCTKMMLKHLNISKLNKGALFSTATANTFSLIVTHIGAPFVGDAVLYLRDTPSVRLFFFGSCGSVPGKNSLPLGSLVMPNRVYALESFSDILSNKKNASIARPDRPLMNSFLSVTKGISINQAGAASFCSFILEPEWVPFFRAKKISVVEMECAAFLNAAENIKRPAISVVYVSDIINTKPFYQKRSQTDKDLIQKGMSSGIAALISFIKNTAKN